MIMFATIQICIFIAAIFFSAKLIRMRNTTPDCQTGICRLDTSRKCEQCQALTRLMEERLPKIVMATMFYLLMLTCFIVMYFAQRLTTNEKYYILSPIIQIMQLSLEVVFSLTIFYAFHKVAKKRFVDKKSKKNKERELESAIDSENLETSTVALDDMSR